VHVDDQVKTKLDDKSKKMIFIGYDQKSKWYKFYNPNEEKMVISRDIEFIEEGAWDWKVNNSKKYDFLSILNEDEKRYEDHQEHKVTHLQTLMSLTSHSLSSSYSSSSSSSYSGSSSSGTLPR